MLFVLSLSVMSSCVVASHESQSNVRPTRSTASLPVTLLDPGRINSTITTPLGGVSLPAASRPSTATSATTPAPSPTTIRDIYVRGHRIQQGDGRRPDAERDRSMYIERPSNSSTKPRAGDKDFRRRRFHLISAAQVNSRIYHTQGRLSLFDLLMATNAPCSIFLLFGGGRGIN